MKKLTLGLFLIIVFTMCKKETQIIYETPAPTLAGEWYGFVQKFTYLQVHYLI